MKSKSLTFPGSQGQDLHGRLDTPDQKKPIAYALFTHCFTCNKNLKPIHNISRALVDQGLGVFRFDFTGLGESKGEFEQTNLTTNIKDVQTAADYMKEHYETPALLIGHSMGGSAVLNAAHNVPDCRAVVTLSTPSKPNHLTQLLKAKNPEVNESDTVTVKIGGRKFTLSKAFFQDLDTHSEESDVASITQALLIVHSQHDEVVNVEHGERLFEQATQPKSIVTLNRSDHLLTSQQDAQYIGQLIAAWMGFYL